MLVNSRCVLWLQVQGPVAQLKWRQLRIHARDAQGRPHELVLKESAKYLGSFLHVGANNKDELRNRVTQANTVHGRLTPRVWRSSSIPLPHKIRLWQTLVLTKALCAVEIRVLGRADLLYLERWQIKKLRHLARSQVHIRRETSEALHRRVQIPTIESQLRVRRLKWWRQLIAPRFAAAARDGIEQGHTWDASLAFRTALLGTFSFETNPPHTTERQRQLLDDAKELVQMHERAQQTHCNFEVPDEISDEFLRWVADLSDEDLAQLHIYDSTLDVACEPAELIPCPQSGRTFRGVKKLATQCRSKHVLQCKSFQVRHVRGARKKTFSTRSNMMYHYHHHCSQLDTPVHRVSQHSPFFSQCGAMSNDPKTPANAQCAVESGGLAAFLRNTAAERARYAVQEAALWEIHRQNGFDVDDTDDPLQQIRFQFLFSLALVD